MRKISIIVALSLALVFGLAMNAMAFTITSLVPTDTNYSVSTSGHAVFEDYNAKALIPDAVIALAPGMSGFTSHDGNAVVDVGPTALTPFIFFDKEVSFTTQELTDNNFQVTFHIKNTTPFTWSNYELILHNDGETVKDASTSSAQFKGVTIGTFNNNLLVEYFFDGPGSKLIDPNDTLDLTLGLNLTGVGTVSPEFELRQIATAVPIPGALGLLASGLAGLDFLGWRRRR